MVPTKIKGYLRSKEELESMGFRFDNRRVYYPPIKNGYHVYFRNSFYEFLGDGVIRNFIYKTSAGYDEEEKRYLYEFREKKCNIVIYKEFIIDEKEYIKKKEFFTDKDFEIW